MGQCQSALDDALYCPPNYDTADLIEAITLRNDVELLQRLLEHLINDERFKAHPITQNKILPALITGVIAASYKKDKELSSIDTLVYKCVLEISSERVNVEAILEADLLLEKKDINNRVIKKLVDNVTYRKDALRSLSCMILARVSEYDCTKLAETTIEQTLNTILKRASMKKSTSTTSLQKAASTLMVTSFTLSSLYSIQD